MKDEFENVGVLTAIKMDNSVFHGNDVRIVGLSDGRSPTFCRATWEFGDLVMCHQQGLTEILRFRDYTENQ